MRCNRKGCIAAVVVAFATAGQAGAQDSAVQAATQSISVPKGFASSAFQVPAAAGGSLGSVGVGVYGQTIDSVNDDADGSVGLNVGLGDPSRWLGLDLSASFSSLFESRGGSDGFGEAGSLGVKVHRSLPGFTSVAIGVQSFGRWGAVQPTSRSSIYAVATKFFMTGGTGIAATVGAGDVAYSASVDGVGPIAAVAWYITPSVSLIGEYTGRFANVALSAAPITSLPMTITVGAVNLNDRFGLGTQFAATVGYGFGI